MNPLQTICIDTHQSAVTSQSAETTTVCPICTICPCYKITISQYQLTQFSYHPVIAGECHQVGRRLSPCSLGSCGVSQAPSPPEHGSAPGFRASRRRFRPSPAQITSPVSALLSLGGEARLTSLPTKFSTPASSKPTAAMIWKRGSLRRPQRGFSSFFAWGMSSSFLLALTMHCVTSPARSLRRSARRYSSGVASRATVLCLAFAAMWPSGSRPLTIPLASLRILPPSSIRGRTSRTSASSSRSSSGVRSALSIFYLALALRRFDDMLVDLPRLSSCRWGGCCRGIARCTWPSGWPVSCPARLSRASPFPLAIPARVVPRVAPRECPRGASSGQS